MVEEKIEKIKFLLKGLKIDSRTEEYIRKRLKSVEKLLNKMKQIEVEVDLDKKGCFRVELMINMPNYLYRAEATTESVEGSTDIAVAELKNQIKSKKGKLKTLQMRGLRSIKKKMALDPSSRF
jgi:ribosomal subunit interface protein